MTESVAAAGEGSQATRQRGNPAGAGRVTRSAWSARATVALFVAMPVNVAADVVQEELDDALAAVRADETQRVEVFARAAKAVVCIFADRQRGGGGSGVVIDPDGYGLTNYHVVQPFIKSRRGYAALPDGRLYVLKVLGIDPGGDIAMFKLHGKERFAFAPLGDSDLLSIGQRVAAMGNPFVLAEDNTPTITLGVISGLHRYQEGQGNLLEYADCIQVSTSINPGNSGGPLFDLERRVIGINGRASFQDDADRHRVNVGLGYAVSINQIKRFIPGLRAGHLLEHGTLGATVRAAGDDLIIDTIQAFSPAENAGLQLGDVLRQVTGRPVRTANDYNNIMATLPADWPVALKLLSNGQSVEKTVRLERLPARMPPYLLELDHNHAELSQVFDRNAHSLGARLEQPWSHVAFHGHIRSADTDAGRPVTLLVTSDDTGVTHDGSAIPSDDGVDASLRHEWQRLALPLLKPPVLDLRWELLAGDEVAGRIVNVVECRFETDRHARWKFDWLTDELLQVAFGDQEEPESVAWSPSAPRQFGDLVWPSRWTRDALGGDPLIIEIDSVTADPAESGVSPFDALKGGASE